MAKTYYLRFLIRNQPNDLVFEVRKQEADRLKALLDSNPGSLQQNACFWFSTVDGRSVAINLIEMQAVRFLWDPADLPSDIVRHEGEIKICLRGREEPIEVYTEHPDHLYDLFTNLEYGPETVPYPKFNDEDGEPFQVNAREVVWVIAPTHLLDEGCRIIAEEDGLDE